MKKIFGICICVLLVAAVVVGSTVAFAEADTTASAQDIIYFLNPTAITTLDGYLFVADRIEDNQSAIICFDVTGIAPKRVATFMLNEIANDVADNEIITNLSDDGSDTLYVITNQQVLEMKWNASKSEISDTGVRYKVQNNAAVDFTYGVYDSSAGRHSQYYLSQDQLLRVSDGKYPNVTDNKFDNTVACYALGNYVYYIYKLGGATYCKRYDGVNHNTDTSDKFNSELNLPLTPLGFFTWKGEIAIFGSKNIATVTVDRVCTVTNVMTNYGVDATDEIVDVSATGGKILVLNNRNVVEIYTEGADGLTQTATIGSDIYEQPVPTVFTSFTLARSTGYPTNIVFKTTGDNSVDALEVLDAGATYVVLGYEGDANSKFYYVLLGDKFGWVKKSDGEDDKLETIDTNVRNDSLTSKAKFISLDAVYVSPLPRLSYYDNAAYRKVYQQSASNRIEVTVLQKFSEGANSWYYVTFMYNGALQSGFVPTDAVGEFSITGSVGDGYKAEQRKINPKLFSTVKVYDNDNPETMTEDHYAYDGKGNQIKLSTGSRVLLVSVNAQTGVAFIQIPDTNTFGYVYADRLIGVNKVTTATTVGLSLLAAALAIGIALAIIFVNRKKKAAQ